MNRPSTYTRLACLLSVVVCALSFVACSTKKNTAGTRFWHSFTTRYNVYYNASQAYIQGLQAQEQGHKDDYTELIPLFPVGNEATAKLGSSNFDTSIEKCEKAIQLHSIKKRPVVSGNKRNTPKMRAYLRRQEFNPFLKNAWLLMGRAQFQKGQFLEAASTFSYITRHYSAEPDVVTEARVWLSRCYSQLGWFYDAEDAVSKLSRDSIPPRLRRQTDASRADLLLRQGRLEEALPYLRTVTKSERSKWKKARLYFLLGQVEHSLGHDEAAYKALTSCIRKSPPYELAFNARILQTEVMSSRPEKASKMVSRLKRMARSGNNKDYLDQVYYAMGNIMLIKRDTVEALKAYETGRAKSTRGGIEKGVLLLRLAGLYWDQARYDKAQACYAEALGIIDNKYEGYDEITRRSKALDQLVPYTTAVQLQDSLQALARMPEAERNAAIDRVIADLKHKEELARRASLDSLAEARKQEAGAQGAGSNSSQQNTNAAQQVGGDKSWYFYNQMQVIQGKQAFQKQWGRRKNEDNWRRANKTVLAQAGNEEFDYAADDSIQAARDSLDALGEVADSVANDSVAADPHKREYYLAQIPFTEEAKAASDAIITDGLYNAGIIEKDQLEDFPLASKTLRRLVEGYPDFENTPDALYQLFLLYSRWKKPDEAARYRTELARRFPDNDLAKMISAPDYERNARFGAQIEDSLYTATYDAYRKRDYATVERNFTISSDKFPTGANRPKFILVHALSRLGRDDDKAVAEELRDLVTKFPQSDVSELAGMIVRGIESGRKPGAGGFDVGSLWARRSEEAQAITDSAGRRRGFTDSRDVPFLCVIAYPSGSIDDGQMLYDLAQFNFAGFLTRNFDLQRQQAEGLTQIRISGFRSFDEAHAYASKLFADKALAKEMTGARTFLVSAENMELIGTAFSFEDYSKFYEKTFAPLKLNPQLPLDLQDQPIEQHYEDEYTPEQLDKQQQDEKQQQDDGGEWYPE